jgi:pimeloyl-ACP methyl ester carboxylesterase
VIRRADLCSCIRARLNHAIWRLLVADPATARAKWDQDRAALLAASPDDLAQGLASYLSPVDVAVRAFLLQWGFQVASIGVPVLLMHGRQDRSVPVSHGEWLAAHPSHRPGARLALGTSFSVTGHSQDLNCLLANLRVAQRVWILA